MIDLCGISQPAFDLIVREEDGDQTYYTRHYEHFDWPAGASGPTVGIGCDLGYMTPEEVSRNWAGIVDDATMVHLKAACGLRGEAAHAFVQAHAGSVTITWDQALAEFSRRELPEWVHNTEAALGPHYGDMHPSCRGALVSVSYNRGASYHAPGPRFVEMRSIAAHVAAGTFAAIPADILLMRRLWPAGSDLYLRREHEAALFADGLGEPAVLPRPAGPSAPAAPTTPAAPPDPGPPAAQAPPAGLVPVPTPVTPGSAPTLPGVLDTNRNTYGKYDALRAAGIGIVGRYLAAGLEAEEKVIKPGEAQELTDHGLQLLLIYEVNGRPRGAAIGNRDGQAARAQATAVGAPAGAIVWYTVDEDAGPAEYPAIAAAFAAFRRALNAGDNLPQYRVGAYASGYISNRLYRDNLCSARWLTDSSGFQGTRQALAAGDYEMAQALPKTVAGLDADSDARHRLADGTLVDIGSFVPFS